MKTTTLTALILTALTLAAVGPTAQAEELNALQAHRVESAMLRIANPLDQDIYVQVEGQRRLVVPAGQLVSTTGIAPGAAQLRALTREGRAVDAAHISLAPGMITTWTVGQEARVQGTTTFELVNHSDEILKVCFDAGRCQGVGRDTIASFEGLRVGARTITVYLAESDTPVDSLTVELMPDDTYRWTVDAERTEALAIAARGQ